MLYLELGLCIDMIKYHNKYIGYIWGVQLSNIVGLSFHLHNIRKMTICGSTTSIFAMSQ